SLAAIAGVTRRLVSGDRRHNPVGIDLADPVTALRGIAVIADVERAVLGDGDETRDHVGTRRRSAVTRYAEVSGARDGGDHTVRSDPADAPIQVIDKIQNALSVHEQAERAIDPRVRCLAIVAHESPGARTDSGRDDAGGGDFADARVVVIRDIQAA